MSCTARSLAMKELNIERYRNFTIEKKEELDIGDIIVYYPSAKNLKHFPCFGIVIQAEDEIIISIKWYGDFHPNNHWSKEALKNCNHIKIFKEVSIKELNI